MKFLAFLLPMTFGPPCLSANKGFLGALIGVGATLLGARKQRKAQERGAEVAAGAQERGAELIYQQFKDTEKRLLPFLEGGQKAFGKQQALSGALGQEAQQQAYEQYEESPGVAFMRQRGETAINRNALMGGQGIGGNQMKALSEFNQGLATQDFQNYFNRLGSVSGMGLNAGQAMAGVGGEAAAGQARMVSGAGATIGQGMVDAGNTRAGMYNEIGSGLGNIYKAWKERDQ